ncbi:MAG: late competence development ComFB family protein [Limnochordia bacterium]
MSKPLEQVVIREVEKHLENNPNICDCPQCKADIIALTLQNLPPRYSTTPQGEVWLKVELQNTQTRMDIFKAMVGAIEKVQTHPRH